MSLSWVSVDCGDNVFECNIIMHGETKQFHAIDVQTGALRARLDAEEYRQLLHNGNIPNIILLD